MLNSFLSLREDSEQYNDQRKKWYSISADSPQGEWDKMAEKMMLEFGESGHPVFRAASPLSRGVLKSKGGGKLVKTPMRRLWDDWNCFSHKYFC